MTEISFDRFNWVDLLAAILLFRMGYVGLRGGLSEELPRLVGLVMGIFISFRWYQAAGDGLSRLASLPVEWAAALAMVALSVAGYLAAGVGLRWGSKLVQIGFSLQFNRLGGAVAGAARGALVASVVLVVCQQLPAPYLQVSIEERSLTGSVVSRAAPRLYDTLTAVPRFLLQSAG